MANTNIGIGSKLGAYLITETIGEGGMGQVFKGFDQKLNRKNLEKTICLRGQDSCTNKRSNHYSNL